MEARTLRAPLSHCPTAPKGAFIMSKTEKGKGDMKSVEFHDLKVVLSGHSFIRYKQRVGEIGWDELENWCIELFEGRKFRQKKKFRLIELDGIWFGYVIAKKELVLETCFGRTHLDMPEALKWARYHNDQIVLSKSEDSGAVK